MIKNVLAMLRRVILKTHNKKGVISTDWEESFLLNFYKSKGEAISCGNYLKLADQVMKLVERLLDPIIHRMAHIDQMQFGFIWQRNNCCHFHGSTARIKTHCC